MWGTVLNDWINSGMALSWEDWLAQYDFDGKWLANQQATGGTSGTTPSFTSRNPWVYAPSLTRVNY